MLKKIVSVLLVLAFVFAIGSEFNEKSSYDIGYSYGKRDAKASSSWFWVFAGLGCGCIGVAAAYFIPTNAPGVMVVGQDPDYMHGYADAYVKTKRQRKVMWAGIGMVIQLLSFTPFFVSGTTT